ncbi:MAG: Dabb family protein [Cellulomonas sp.]|jgi:heme-degrading monooxygenase HmoA|nr:Dabb family protein [Cellulomonas sp.]
MIRHVVMWTFAAEAGGADRAANVARARAELAQLDGLVPGMHNLEVVAATEHLEHTHDLLLVADFDTEAALKAYSTHPRHVAVASFIAEVRTGRACFDYET